MRVNLIIDGNYILSKTTFSLHKINELKGNLEASMQTTIKNYLKWYHFANIYFVSDNKSSWRKNIYTEYKAKRVKNEDIDWDYVYKVYENFKNNINSISNRIVLLEGENLEGDDWVSYICKYRKEKDVTNIIVSNDGDMKQLMNYSVIDNCINIMTNEMYNNGKLFLPSTYKVFFNNIRKSLNNDLFDIGVEDDLDYINFIDDFINRRDIVEIDSTKEFVIKLIHGDIGDNISSVYISKTKTGKDRGIGAKGALNIYNKYFEEFGQLDLDTDEYIENLADIICESKKISYTENLEMIKSSIQLNKKVIDLHNLPRFIIEKMEKIFTNRQELKSLYS